VTKLTETAEAIVVALRDGPMFANAFHDRVADLGGHRTYVADAAKHLRNKGIPVYATKARHLSEWCIDPDETQSGLWAQRLSQEAYSETVSLARALALSSDRRIKKVRNRVVANAINCGIDLGKSPSEVITECEPVAV